MRLAPSRWPALVNPVGYARALIEGGRLFAANWTLIVALARRDLAQRHKGQVIGAAWLIGHPLFLTALYVFVFAVVFQLRVGGSHDLPLDYATYVLSGLIPWMTFQQSMMSATTSVVGNAALVKQFVFRLELLPAKDVVMSLVFWCVGIPALLAYEIIAQGAVYWLMLLLPAALIFQVMAMIGVALALSALTVFIRDIKDVVSVFCTAGMFLVPVAYLPGWIPDTFRPVVYANPFSYMVWVYQDILYFGRFEHPLAWVVFACASLAAFAGGFRLFTRLKPVFASTL